MSDTNYWSRLRHRRLSRRHLLGASARAGVGAAGLALVGCGDDDDDDAAAQVEDQADAQADQADTGDDGATVGDLPIPADPSKPTLAPDYDFVFSGAPKSGGILHLTSGTPGNFNPNRDAGYPGLQHAGPTLSNIVRANWRIDGEVEYEGDLAESLPEQPDDQTYVFTLLPNTRWHNTEPVNGRELTSEDIATHYEYLVTDEPDFVLRPAFNMIDRVDTPDARSFTVHTAFPYAPFIDNNSDVWAKVLPREQHEGNISKSRPVGSGPFIADEVQTGVLYKYLKNPDYYREGQPYVDELWYHVFPPGNTALPQSAFISEETDIWASGIASLAEETIERKPNANWSWRWFVLNPIMLNNSREPFTDERVRQAVMFAVDQEAIAELTFGGFARQGQNVGLFNEPVLLPDSELPQRDVAQSRQLLDAAGFADGLDVVDKTFQGGSQAFGTLQVQEALAEAGINMTIEELEWANWRTNVYGITGDFALTMGGEFDFLSTDRQLFNSYHSTGAANNRHVADPTLDQMLEDARGIFDRDEANSAYQDIQRYLYEHAINVPLANGAYATGTTRRVKGWYPSASAGVLFSVQWLDQVWLDDEV